LRRNVRKNKGGIFFALTLYVFCRCGGLAQQFLGTIFFSLLFFFLFFFSVSGRAVARYIYLLTRKPIQIGHCYGT